MKDSINSMDEATLHAYVDGQLSAYEAAAVARWLREHPDDAQRVLEWRSQRAGLQALHAELLDEPLPEAVLSPLQPPAANAPRYARQALAAALLLGVGLAGGWGARDLLAPPVAPMAQAPAFVRDAAIAHVLYQPEQRHPVEVGAAEQAHLLQWLSKRLGTPLRAPDLTAAGFALVGGRLLPAGEAQPQASIARAQFMYESAAGERITLYVSVAAAGRDEPPAFHFAELAGAPPTQSFYWIEGRLGYALSGQLPRDRIAQLGGMIYGQLGRG